jgi:imidazole glycerol phosphate synthase glutamine amidotransferase subunit
MGRESVLVDETSGVEEAEFLLLPGVGAFGDAMQRIDERGLRAPILEHVRSGRPLLGICLGMQVLFDASEESPGVAGLGILAGIVRKFSGVRVPHIGWNEVRAPGGGMPQSSVVCYFVHSFYVPSSPGATGYTTHGVEFVSAIRSGRVAGFQFHPEKSHDAGLALLDRTIGALAGTGGAGE